MAAALVIAAKDLRLRLRDRSALVIALIAPLGLATILSFALGGAETFHPTFVVADLDQGAAGRAFVEDVLGSPELRDVATITEVDTREDAERLVAEHEAAAGFVIPAGFTSALQGGDIRDVVVLRAADRPIAGQVATGIAEGFIGRLSGVRLATITVCGAVPEGCDAAAVGADAAATAQDAAPAIEVSADALPGTEGSQAGSYYGPAMAIFFLFFTVGFGARGLLSEAQQGTLARLLVAPIAGRSIILGKALGTFVLGLVSVSVVIAVSVAALDASYTSTAGVVLVIVAAVVAAMGITALVATLARTPEQADGYSGAIATVLALLGGNFLPLSQAPELMQRLSSFTPNGWVLRAFTQLSTVGTSLADVAPEAAAAAAFGVVSGALALVRSRHLVAAR